MNNQTAPTFDEFLAHYRNMPQTHQGLILALCRRANDIPLADLARLTADVIAAPFEKRSGVVAEYLTAQAPTMPG